MTVVRIVALVLVLVGALILRISLGEGGRLARVTIAGPIAEVRFQTGQKTGHYVALRLEGASDTYQRTHLQHVEGLEERLRARLAVGTPVELVTIERPLAGEFAVADLPLVIHELREGGELLFDAAAFDRNVWVAYVAPVIGGLVALAGLGLFVLSFALGARARG